MLNLTVQNGEVAASEAYFTRDMKNHHGGMVLVDGYLYGYNDQILTCLEFATGKLMWRDRSIGKGSVTYADGHTKISYTRGAKHAADSADTGDWQGVGRWTVARGLSSSRSSHWPWE